MGLHERIKEKADRLSLDRLRQWRSAPPSGRRFVIEETEDGINVGLFSFREQLAFAENEPDLETATCAVMEVNMGGQEKKPRAEEEKENQFEIHRDAIVSIFRDAASRFPTAGDICKNAERAIREAFPSDGDQQQRDFQTEERVAIPDTITSLREDLDELLTASERELKAAKRRIEATEMEVSLLKRIIIGTAPGK